MENSGLACGQFLFISLIKQISTNIISIASESDAANCPTAAAGIGSSGQGSINVARQARNNHTTVRK